MNSADRLLLNTETKWLQQLQEHCKMIFSGVHLPSHDETHHVRVWQYARQLVHELEKKSITLNEIDLEMLIISIFFHDTGMSETMQKEHGKISRRIAKDYLRNWNLSSGETEMILDAVEHHDEKDYSLGNTGSKPEYSVQSMLNLCDDLDAIGFIGAYRYFEIYTLRHLSLKELPEAVLSNLNIRFQHMKYFLNISPNYLRLQNQRYMATRNFYKDLIFQMKQIGDDLNNLNGPLGVINFLKEFVIQEKLSVLQACNKALLISGDFYVTNFFEKLEKECKLTI